jgi:hypothetical protein
MVWIHINFSSLSKTCDVRASNLTPARAATGGFEFCSRCQAVGKIDGVGGPFSSTVFPSGSER